MSDYPPDWDVIELGRVGTWLSGGTPSTSNPAYWEGEIPWISAASLKSFEIRESERNVSELGSRSGTRRVPAGTVIFVVRGMSLKTEFRVGITSREVTFGQDCKAVLSPGGVDARFLAYSLKAKQNEILAMVDEAGHGTGRLPTRQLERLRVGFPDECEQRRIVDMLNSVDESIQSIDNLVAKLESSRHGLLDAMFPHSTVSRGSSSGSFGQYFRADSVCTRITVGVVNSATGSYVDSGVPFLRSQNVRPNFIDTSGMLYISESFNNAQSKSRLQSGDVVVVRTGYPGTAAVVPPELDGANCFSLLVATPTPALSPHFLALYLNSPAGKRAISNTHFGSAQHNFNVAEMRNLKLPVPSLAEQENALDLVSGIDSRIAASRAELKKMWSIKQGVVGDLLSGKRRLLS